MVKHGGLGWAPRPLLALACFAFPMIRLWITLPVVNTVCQNTCLLQYARIHDYPMTRGAGGAWLAVWNSLCLSLTLHRGHVCTFIRNK